MHCLLKWKISMLYKHSLLAVSILFSTHVFANIPIESRGLSQNSSSQSPNTPPASNSVSSNSTWDLIQQVQRLEQQLRTLQGKLDEQDNQINQLNNELKNRYTDLDQRLELIQQKVDPSEENSTNEQSTPAEANAPASTTSTTISPVINKSNLTNTGSTSQTTATKIPQPNITITGNQTELEKAAYTVALDAYKQGGAKKAIAPMQNFIKNNPNSIYTGNAYFWLAEFNLAIEPPNYEEARKNYEIVASKFPNSGKVSRSLYQLYSIAKDVNKNNQTAEIYKKKLLANYPQSEEASYFKKS